MSRRRRTLVLNGALAAVLVIAAAGAYVLLGSSDAGAETATTRTVPVTTADIEATVTASGTLSAVSQVAANFDTSGTVTSVEVSVGDTVSKGEALATLDRSDAKTQVALAEAALTSAQAQLNKPYEGTITTDPATGKSTTTVDSSQVAQNKASVTQAEASLADAEDALAATTLTAPISGTVLSVDGIVGSSVGSGASSSSSTGSTDFIVIANLKAMKVSVSFSESDIGSIKVGQAAAITFPAAAGVTATGKVVSIDPNSTVTNSVVTYGAVVKLSSVPKGVRLGQTADVSITTDSATNAVVVPSLAITARGDRSMVTVVKDGVATPTEVETGVVGTSYTQILSGVVEGDMVQLDLSSVDTTSTGNTGNTFGAPTVVGGP